MSELIRWMIHQRWVRRLVGPLFGKSNPLSEQRRNDPYPVFREMRESDPVYRSPVLRISRTAAHQNCVDRGLGASTLLGVVLLDTRTNPSH